MEGGQELLVSPLVYWPFVLPFHLSLFYICFVQNLESFPDGAQPAERMRVLVWHQDGDILDRRYK